MFFADVNEFVTYSMFNGTNSLPALSLRINPQLRMQINFPLWSQVGTRYMRETGIRRTRTIGNSNGKLCQRNLLRLHRTNWYINAAINAAAVYRKYSVASPRRFHPPNLRCITYDVRYKETKNSRTDNEIQTAKDKRHVFATSINLPYISYSGPVDATVSLKRIRSSLSNKDLLANYEFILSLSLSSQHFYIALWKVSRIDGTNECSFFFSCSF